MAGKRTTLNTPCTRVLHVVYTVVTRMFDSLNYKVVKFAIIIAFLLDCLFSIGCFTQASHSAAGNRSPGVTQWIGKPGLKLDNVSCTVSQFGYEIFVNCIGNYFVK